MYDPQVTPPPPVMPPPAPRRNPLLWVALGLGAFVLLMTVALVAVVLLTPAIRTRLPFIGAGSPPPPEAPRKEQVASNGPINISDTFDQASSRWDQSLTQVVENSYEIRLDTPNYDGYGLFLGPEIPADTPLEQVFRSSQIENFDMAVDVQQVAGSPVSEYGIRFRQSGPGDFLLFSISGNGYYRLAQVRDEAYSSAVPWTFDRRIRTGANATNRLRVVANGTQITGYINGEQVLNYTDPQVANGQLTLGLVTYDNGGLVVRFTNIEGQAELIRPSDQQTQEVDLKETFGDPTKARWSIGGSTIADGSYQILAGPGLQTWQQPLPKGSSRVTGNFVIEAEAALVSGPVEEAAYGIMFGDGGNFDFYTLLILPQGGITMRRSGPQAQDIIPPIAFPVVKPGLNAVNKIRVEVRDSKLRISINDEALPEIDIPQDVKIEGMAGMLVSSGQNESVQVRFNSFTLEELR
ncbi:MAG: DUF1080 domain-containing protein [Chloroflexaceae bacterium]|jgi:hypothetical protein|nr:DUF1080 domain-containing protein [Chloroflexaceae bacterium]